MVESFGNTYVLITSWEFSYVGEKNVSVMLDRIKKVNEVNRLNIDKTLREYNEKVKAEMNGMPMKATRENDFYVWRNKELIKIASAG